MLIERNCSWFEPRWETLSLRAPGNPSTLYPTPYTLHPTPYTLHPTPYTLHTTHYTLHTTHYTLNTTHYTLHSSRFALQAPRQALRLISCVRSWSRQSVLEPFCGHLSQKLIELFKKGMLIERICSSSGPRWKTLSLRAPGKP